MSETVDPDNRVMSSIADTFDLVMSAKHEAFTDLPQSLTIEFSGDEAEAKGSARHVADVVREAGYSVELEYVGRVEDIEALTRARHEFRFTVSDD